MVYEIHNQPYSTCIVWRINVFDKESISMSKKSTKTTTNKSTSTGTIKQPNNTSLCDTDETASSERVRAKVDFPIVGIGASAGGLEAVSALLEPLPSDIGMAFVLVQHLAPEHDSMMSELLSRVTSLKVTEITDGLTIQPNTVYVIPPDSDLGIINSVLQLVPRSVQQHLPIDYFFDCLAQDQQSNAIGVILSGSASDGSRGIKSIKSKHGITFAQSPETARYDSMPSSAIASGCVDFILSPAAIADELVYLSRHAKSIAAEAMPEKKKNRVKSNDYEKIFMFLRNRTGNDFSLYKQSTIQRRISRRMMVNRIESLKDYIHFLNSHPMEVDALFQDILINVTEFFRDPDSFEALKKSIFPAIFQGRDAELPVRIWVPGCSTGEEVYSIIISLLEYLGENVSRTKIQVFASDIDEQAIEKARAGIYPETITSNVSAERLRRFFNKVSKGYQINKRVRDLCVFATQNITKDPPFSHLDLAVCRNLLIYMSNLLQRKVLQTLHYSLNSGGILFLGNCETIGSSADIFSPVDNENKFYVKKDVPRNARFRSTNIVSDIPSTSSSVGKSPVIQVQSIGLQQFAESIILSHYSPPGIVVNKQFDVIQFIGNTGPYLEPTPGSASLNVIKLVHPDLTAELRVVVHTAVNNNTLAKAEHVYLHRDKSIEDITIEVLPLKMRMDGEIYFLIMFRKNSEYDPEFITEKSGRQGDEQVGAEDSGYIEKLKKEQDISKAYMQAIIEDHEASNEELQAANEEIQSTNEELQSTNEELETAKEELQSTNEELITVNEELEKRNRELHMSNDDLKNIISSTNLAVVMLNDALSIRFFSPQAHRLLNLINSDIGRPIGDIRANVNVGDLTQYVNQVIDTLRPINMEVNDNQNSWYSMVIRPYRTEDNHISGAVIIFTDITESKLLQRASRLATVVEDSNDAIMVLNFNGSILEWNQKSAEIYGYEENEAVSKNIEIIVPATRRKELTNAFNDLQKGKQIKPFETQRVNKSGDVLKVLVTLSALNNEKGDPVAVAATERLLKPSEIN